jgi:hypothetical protein
LEQGLYKKFTVINNETGEEVQEQTFTLNPQTDPIAKSALLHYASETPNQALRNDIRNWLQDL